MAAGPISASESAVPFVTWPMIPHRGVPCLRTPYALMAGAADVVIRLPALTLQALRDRRLTMLAAGRARGYAGP